MIYNFRNHEYGVVDENAGTLVGTSTLVALQGERFLLTAAHVARQKLSDAFVGLAHTTRSGAPPHLVTDRIYCEDALDLALIPVSSTLQVDTVAVEAEALADTSDGTDGDLLFIHGFPESRSHSFSFVHSETLPYLTTAGPPHAFDPAVRFSLDYPAEGIVDERGGRPSLTKPNGMSGSTVWATGFSRDADSWTPSRSRIIGVITHWDQAAQCLIGTRVEFVREFLVHTLRQRLAHRHWQQRGAPSGDDWSDWFTAVRELPHV